MARNRLAEAKDLNLYTQIMSAFIEYVDNAPMSGYGNWLDKLTELGSKCVPSDERAQQILAYALNSRSSAFAVSQFMNLRFDDLPIGLRPLYLAGKVKKTALWKSGERKYDRVQQLINWGGGEGSWVDASGEPVKLIDAEVASRPKKTADAGTVQVGEARAEYAGSVYRIEVDAPLALVRGNGSMVEARRFKLSFDDWSVWLTPEQVRELETKLHDLYRRYFASWQE